MRLIDDLFSDEDAESERVSAPELEPIVAPSSWPEPVAVPFWRPGSPETAWDSFPFGLLPLVPAPAAEVLLKAPGAKESALNTPAV